MSPCPPAPSATAKAPGLAEELVSCLVQPWLPKELMPQSLQAVEPRRALRAALPGLVPVSQSGFRVVPALSFATGCLVLGSRPR